MSSVPPQGPAAAGKGVWIAVFAMGAIIVALLAAVLFKLSQGPAAKPETAAASAAAPAQLASAAKAASAPTTTATLTATTAAPAAVAPSAAENRVKPQPAPVRQATSTTQPRPVTQQAQMAQQSAPQQFAPQQFAPQQVPAQAQPAPAATQQAVCSTCGTVIAATPQQVQSQQPNPVGIIAGGIVGGLLGNQVGGGDGRKLATVAGAIGGGFAGNEIAKRVDAQTIYNVQVRMDDGQVRTLQLKVAPPVGQRVQIGADGGLNPIP